MHYNIGVSAYRQRQYDKARTAFERVALTPSMAAVARYNLGLVALAANESQRAIDEFARAYALSEDERVRTLARTQLEAIGAPPASHEVVWSAYGSSGIGHDDNVTLTSAGQALGLARGADIYTDTFAVGSAQLTDALLATADASFLNYVDLNEFDQWSIGSGGRYRMSFDPWMLDAGAHLAVTYLDGERLDVRESAYLQAVHPLAAMLSLRARYRLSNVDGSGAYTGLDGLRHELSARLVHRGASWVVGAGYGFEVSDYSAASLSAVRHQLSTDVRGPLSAAWAARASLAYRRSDYDDSAVGTERRIELGASAEYALSARWTLAIQYIFTDSDADAPEFTYRRNRIFVGVDATF